MLKAFKARIAKLLTGVIVVCSIAVVLSVLTLLFGEEHLEGVVRVDDSGVLLIVAIIAGVIDYFAIRFFRKLWAEGVRPYH